MKFKLSDNTKTFIIALIIPLAVGFLTFLLTKNGISYYSDNLIKPAFAPKGYVFGIVWTILYILMGISSYLIYKDMSCHKDTCLLIYGLNLVLNFLWPLIFFNLEARLFAFIFIIFLDMAYLKRQLIYKYHI